MTPLIKFPGETRDYAFEFADQVELQNGETLTGTPTVTATLRRGTPTTLTLGTPTINGSQVQISIAGGTLGDHYDILCIVATNASHTIAALGRLRIARPYS